MSCLPLTADTYPPETLPEGWRTYQVTLGRDGYTRLETFDEKRGDRYVHEPMRMIAFKCVLLVLFTPVYLIGYLGFQFLRTPLTSGFVICQSLYRTGKNPSLPQMKQLGKDCFLTAPACFVRGMWAIVKAPFYAMALQGAALYGVFSPLEGRVWIGFLERNWHGTKGHRDDFSYLLKTSSLSRSTACSLLDKNFSHTLYLAFCMQSLGKIEDSYLIEKKPVS